MIEKQRQQLIIDLLEEQQFASVQDLCHQLKASEATIRRDIVKLANNNKIKKIRGGVETIKEKQYFSGKTHLKGSVFLAEMEERTDAKRRIAEKAVKLCEQGESIIINGGTSTFMMCEFLFDRELKILTNSFYLATELAIKSQNQLTLPGGEIYRKQGIILSAFDNDSIAHYHATKMFMGTPAIGKYGVMESDPLLVRAEQKLLKQSEKLIILADSSKIGKRSNLIVGPLSCVDLLITDDQVDDKAVSFFEGEGVKVLVAESK